MHLYMSSYTHAEYLPPVFDLPSLPILHMSARRGQKPEKSSPRLSGSGYTTPECIPSGLPCNTLPQPVSREYYPGDSSEDAETVLADLVRSDERFLDQLEVMHYLSFSDC
ncbi:MAG: hypothetical protein LUQ07_03995 [Methanospirillum sp.]|nr:hypothetical protein [Methanospirillum sp.]